MPPSKFKIRHLLIGFRTLEFRISYHIVQEATMLEVEMKFPAANWNSLERQLAAWGAKELDIRREEDYYFNAPDRDFAQTDEALRLRRIGSSNYLTYKGPKKDPETKTRLEVEVPIAPGHEPAQALTQLLEHLGYRSVAVVEKERLVLQVDKG